jgi:hypothetical protein
VFRYLLPIRRASRVFWCNYFQFILRREARVENKGLMASELDTLIKIIQRLQWLQENKQQIQFGDLRDDLEECAQALNDLRIRLYL